MATPVELILICLVAVALLALVARKIGVPYDDGIAPGGWTIARPPRLTHDDYRETTNGAFHVCYLHRCHNTRCRGQYFSAMLDFIRYKAKVGVSESWITTLGILKAAGALGLLIGIAVPAIGIVAAAGLVLFFIAAIITHLRGHDYSFGLAIVFLLLAIAALGMRVVSS